MRHYAEDVVFSSPYIAALGFEESGTIRGSGVLKEYFGKALERAPEIHFELLKVATGVDRLVAVYRNHRDQWVAEVMTLRDGLVVTAAAHYSASPALESH